MLNFATIQRFIRFDTSDSCLLSILALDGRRYAEDQTTNARVHVLLEAIAKLDVILSNDETSHTFRWKGLWSTVDLRDVSAALASRAELTKTILIVATRKSSSCMFRARRHTDNCWVPYCGMSRIMGSLFYTSQKKFQLLAFWMTWLYLLLQSTQAIWRSQLRRQWQWQYPD